MSSQDWGLSPLRPYILRTLWLRRLYGDDYDYSSTLLPDEPNAVPQDGLVHLRWAWAGTGTRKRWAHRAYYSEEEREMTCQRWSGKDGRVRWTRETPMAW